jgi:hypothetical protein
MFSKGEETHVPQERKSSVLEAGASISLFSSQN